MSKQPNKTPTIKSKPSKLDSHLVAEGPQKGPYLEIATPETLAAQGF